MTHKSISGLAAQWLPEAQFKETHQGLVRGKPEAIIDMVEHLDVTDDIFIRNMLALRELPSRLLARVGGASNLKGTPPFGIANFTRLERTESTLVFGLCGQFWKLDFGLQDIESAEAFKTLDNPEVARLVMLYTLEETSEAGKYNLITQTLVHCPSRSTRLRFTPYWYVIRLGSGFIRKRALSLIAAKLVEQSR